LYRQHFRIDLNDSAYQPVANSITFTVVIAINLHVVAHLESFLTAGRRGKVKLCHLTS
jgi:hypothetical protein